MKFNYRQIKKAEDQFRSKLFPTQPLWTVFVFIEGLSSDSTYHIDLLEDEKESEVLRRLFFEYWVEPVVWCFGVHEGKYNSSVITGLEEITESLYSIYQDHTPLTKEQFFEQSRALLWSSFGTDRDQELVGRMIQVRACEPTVDVQLIIVADKLACSAILMGAFASVLDEVYEVPFWRTGDPSMYSYNYWTDPNIPFIEKRNRRSDEIKAAFAKHIKP